MTNEEQIISRYEDEVKVYKQILEQVYLVFDSYGLTTEKFEIKQELRDNLNLYAKWPSHLEQRPVATEPSSNGMSNPPVKDFLSRFLTIFGILGLIFLWKLFQ